MNRPIIGQIVGYVTPTTKTEPSKIVEAKVLDVYNDGEVLLDYSEGDAATKNYREHRAQAWFNDDQKTENTWHERDAQAGSPAAPARRPSAKEAAAAS